MRNLENGNWWLLHRNNFINRKYLMQEIYQSYIEGETDWDVAQVRTLALDVQNNYLYNMK